LTSPEAAPPKGEENEMEGPRSIAHGFDYAALLLAAFAVLAFGYAALVAAGVLAFNSGAWVVGEEVAMRGWLAYLISAVVHAVAAFGWWRQWKWARWLGVFVLAAGLLPAVPGISAAVVDLRIGGIALWGSLMIVRCAALYALFNVQ